MSRVRRDQRGTTLVEMSIVALITLTMILAMFEFGLLFRDNLTATDAVADAAHIGSVVGNNVTPLGGTADYEVVKAVRDGLASLNDRDVQYVVVFKASGGGAKAENQLPSACKAGRSVAGVCNVYPSATAFADVESGDVAHFTCAGPNTSACPWNPTTRSNGPSSAAVDRIGVYLKIERGGYTGLFGNSWTITRAMISRLEPGLIEP